MSKVDLLKEQIAEKEKYIEQMKQEQNQRAEQLKAKYEAEINGIESKIGSIVEQRRAMLEQKQAAEREADKVHENAKEETRKAQKSLAEAKNLIPNTKQKQATTYKAAQKALDQEIGQIIKTAQNEIKSLQKQMQAEGKAK